jgi:hypothetical protein
MVIRGDTTQRRRIEQFLKADEFAAAQNEEAH